MNKDNTLNYIESELKNISGSAVFVNISQTARVYGLSREIVAKKLSPLKWFQNGKEKLFNIPEVAEIFYNSMEGGI